MGFVLCSSFLPRTSKLYAPAGSCARTKNTYVVRREQTSSSIASDAEESQSLQGQNADQVEETVKLVSPSSNDVTELIKDGIANANAALESGGDLSLAGSQFSEDLELPKLYDSWFAPNHQLAGAMMGAISRAHADGIRQMELNWPCVPNLEEISAGTALNQCFGFQVAADLGLNTPQTYPLVKRYLASYSNLYWAKRIAAAPPFRSADVYAVRSDSVKVSEATLGNLQVIPIRNRPKLEGNNDVGIVIDPRYNDSWYTGAKMRDTNSDQSVIYLNSQFNETYGLTGPRKKELKDVEVVYLLKRVTRGYVFRAYPGKFLAYLEKPDCSVEIIEEFEKEPKLSMVAKKVREESNRRYGSFYNDRYVAGMGGRL